MREAMLEWMSEERVKAVFSTKQINYLKNSYAFIFLDEYFWYDPEAMEDIESTLLLPLAQEYLYFLLEEEGWITNDTESEEEYLAKNAVAVLMANILDAAASVFEFPLWKCKDGLDEVDLAISQAKARLVEEDYSFVRFFPFVTKNSRVIERDQFEWVIAILEHFRDTAYWQDFYEIN